MGLADRVIAVIVSVKDSHRQDAMRARCKWRFFFWLILASAHLAANLVAHGTRIEARREQKALRHPALDLGQGVEKMFGAEVVVIQPRCFIDSTTQKGCATFAYFLFTDV